MIAVLIFKINTEPKLEDIHADGMEMNDLEMESSRTKVTQDFEARFENRKEDGTRLQAHLLLYMKI